MRQRKGTQKKAAAARIPRCWEFFHCLESRQKECLIPETREWRCWRLNIACCQMDKDTPRPLSVKKIICKTCAYYREFNKLA